MKVIQINCVSMHGSTGRLVTQISNYLTSKGVESLIAHGVPGNKNPNEYLINSALDAHLHSFISRKFCRQGLASSWPTYRLIQYIKKYDPDIIHLHNLHGHYLNYKILFRYLQTSRAKVVWTFHDCWAMTGKCAHFSKIGCDLWASEEGCHDCRQLSTYPDSTRDRSAKNYAEKKKLFSSIPNMTIVTVSEWLKSISKRSFLKSIPAICIHNGIDTGIFYPRKSNILKKYGISGKRVVLGVSNIWNGQKGEEQFVQLAQILPSDYVILLVGRNSDQVAAQSNRMFGIGQTESQEELAELYSAADVFISMSVEESFSLVPIEAMACGTPIIVFNSTGLPEAVKEGCGFVVAPGDVPAMGDCILRIANSNEDYEKNCVSHVNSGFTLPQMCENYYKLYKKILGDE